MITGYDSDSESDNAPAAHSPPTSLNVAAPADAPTASSSSSAPVAAAAPVRAKKVVDYNSLIKGVSKPLNLQAPIEEDDDFAPMLPKSRPGILASLPPPKRAKPTVTVEIPGLIEPPAPSSIKPPPATSSGAMASRALPTIEEDEAAQDSDDDGTAAASGCFFNFRPKEEDIREDEPIERSLPSDMGVIHQEVAAIPEAIPEERTMRENTGVPMMMAGLTAREMQELRDCAITGGLTDVKGENLNDPLWYVKSAGKKTTVTGIMKDLFESQVDKVGDATVTQKRKHQINWLASEYHEKGAELLEKSGVGKSEQGKTARKYGW
eukprot:GEMP01074450.1.p1 GENE.GEMP01074450.1~~GEMP01074450.1.p1  ORF type:complete len:322 (+),score=109.12 GEMP01074450.1:106-1071(+)